MQFTQSLAMGRMVKQMIDQYIGKEGTLVYLNATQYNGLHCDILGSDVPLDLKRCARLKVAVQVDGKRKCLLVKLRNIHFDDDIHIAKTSYTGENLSPATFDEIVLASRLVVQHHAENSREDMNYRASILRDWLTAVDGAAAGVAGESKQSSIAFPAISCQVRHKTRYDQLTPQMRLLDSVQPACRGDGTVDLTRFTEGLRPAPSASCCICMELLSSESSNSSQEECGLVLLPCNHMFHHSCLAHWFNKADAERNLCPQCRGANSRPIAEYTINSKRRFVERVFEWVQSGMCVVCQCNFIETDSCRFETTADGVTRMVGLSSMALLEASGTQAPGCRVYNTFGPKSSLVPDVRRWKKKGKKKKKKKRRN